MIRIFAAAALAAASLAVPATAIEPTSAEREQRRAERQAANEVRVAERRQRFFMSVWRIAESTEPLGRRTVTDGDYVLRNRLLPLSLVRLTADAVEKAVTNMRVEVEGLPFDRIRFGAERSETTPAIFGQNTLEIRDSLTQVFGNHVLKYGGEYRREFDNNDLSGGARPGWPR